MEARIVTITRGQMPIIDYAIAEQIESRKFSRVEYRSEPEPVLTAWLETKSIVFSDEA